MSQTNGHSASRAIIKATAPGEKLTGLVGFKESEKHLDELTDHAKHFGRKAADTARIAFRIGLDQLRAHREHQAGAGGLKTLHGLEGQ